MEIIKTPQLLERLGISRPYLKRLIDEHGFPVIDTGGQKLLFDWKKVQEWFDSRSRGKDETTGMD